MSPRSAISRPRALSERPGATISFIAVQLLPTLLLAIVYTRVSTTLATHFLGGVTLERLLLTSAVVGPILGQTVSGPLFRALQGVDRTDLRALSRVVLRNFPKALLLSIPAIALTAIGLAHFTRLSTDGTIALGLVLGVHVVFAGSLVAAFAKRSGLMISFAWVSYAVTLFLAPEEWWAPAVAGIVSQLIVLLVASRAKVATAPSVSIASMLHGLIKGLAQAMPLWALPVALFITDSDAISPAVIFAALAPALIVYQVYFSTVANPLWVEIDDVRDSLSNEPYAQAKAKVASVAHFARRGEYRIVALVINFAIVLVPVMLNLGSADSGFVLAMFCASGLSVLLVAQLTRLSMLREGPGHYVAAGVIALNLIVDASFGLPPVQLLLQHSMVVVVLIAIVAISNRSVWRTPEHTMFWRSALSQ